jgi:hypothetical protein
MADMLARPAGTSARRRARRSNQRRAERAGFGGLLPHRLLRWRRPTWWQELAIIAVGYWLYSLGRNAIPEQASIAVRHGFSVQHLQDALHLNADMSINRFVAAHEWLAQGMDYYYASLHFLVTIGLMLWLFIKRPQVYRGARTVLVTTTLLALAGFALYPLAPPRLLPATGYVDTVARFHTWGSLASPSVASHSNQFAAMPSMHVAWALWCGISLFRCARTRLVRTTALAYPLATLAVVIGTANHFIIDAIAGAAALAAAFGIQWLLSGHGAYTPPFDAPDFGLPDPPLPSLHQSDDRGSGSPRATDPHPPAQETLTPVDARSCAGDR